MDARARALVHTHTQFVNRKSDGKCEKEINHIIVYTHVFNGRTKELDGGTTSGAMGRDGEESERKIEKEK